MTDPVVALGRTRVQLQPGQVADNTITICNVGDVVERYGFEMLGRARGWECEFIPDSLALLPGAEAEARVILRPPTGDVTPVGEIPFGVRVVSAIDKNRCAVAEGELVFAAVRQLAAKLVTVTGRGRHRGRYRLDIQNTGTTPLVAVVRARQAGDALSFVLEPDRVVLPRNSSASVYLLVRPVRPNLVGARTLHSFSVGYGLEGQSEELGDVDGLFEQRPVLPRGAIGTVGLAAILAVGGVGAIKLLDTGDRSSPVAAPAAEVTGAYVLYDGLYPVSVESAYANAERQMTVLRSQGAQVKLLDSRDSPVISSGEPRYLLYFDGFPDVDSAAAYCARWQSVIPCTSHDAPG